MLHGELCWEEQGDQSSWCAGERGVCARVGEGDSRAWAGWQAHKCRALDAMLWARLPASRLGFSGSVFCGPQSPGQ